jgi:hypothetical protein
MFTNLSVPHGYAAMLSSSKGAVSLPNISLTAKGGSIFPVYDPIITITDASSKPIGYCLAIMKSEGVNLIGGELLYSALLHSLKMSNALEKIRFCLNHSSDV